MSGFPTVFYLNQADGILSFHSHVMGAPLSGTGALNWEPNVGLKPLNMVEESLQLRYSSRFSTTTDVCGASPFSDFVPATSLYMAFSVYP